MKRMFCRAAAELARRGAYHVGPCASLAALGLLSGCAGILGFEDSRPYPDASVDAGAADVADGVTFDAPIDAAAEAAAEPAPEGAAEPTIEAGPDANDTGVDVEAAVDSSGPTLEAGPADASFDAPPVVDAGCSGRICSGSCVDVLTDKYNCGACAVQCIADGTHPVVPPGTCTAGYCLTVTPGGITSGTVGVGIGSSAIANVYVTDATAGPNQYTAAINWGDGQVAAGTLKGSSGGGYFQVVGSHTYYTPGSFSVVVTVNALKTGGSSSTSYVVAIN